MKLNFKQQFGFHVEAIDGVVIMTDADSSMLQAVANYRDLDFSTN